MAFVLAALAFLLMGAHPAKAEPASIVSKKLVALTFDDGPSVYTDDILDVLEQYGARATFCVRGNRVEKYAELLRRAVEMGCEVIGHGWNHRELPKLKNDEVRRQLLDTQQAIADATGVMPPMMYRPPYLSTSARVMRISEELGFMVVGWSFAGDSNRETARGAERTCKVIKNNVYHGAIILCHDIAQTTKIAMRTVIPDLIDQGYELVTLSQLMEAFGQEIVPGGVWSGVAKPGGKR